MIGFDHGARLDTEGVAGHPLVVRADWRAVFALAVDEEVFKLLHLVDLNLPTFHIALSRRKMR